MVILNSREYKKLASHNSSCNEVYFKFQDCLIEHPYGKWIGKCTDYGKELEICVKKNLEDMRAKNRQLALEKHEKMKHGDFSL